ncbi:MAG: hypothetical protein FJY29_05680 [Betaproteobacteria bacterium]|nr:hypothetical protein [Betaproteobacteria bacterium]
MQLKSIALEKVAVGDVLVGRSLSVTRPEAMKLVIVQELEAEAILLAPFAATFADDDTDEPSDGEVRISKKQAKQTLACPELEAGDRLLHRERLATIIETKQNDWHVKIRYNDAAGGEFYGNLIWMDLSPTLTALELARIWPS